MGQHVLVRDLLADAHGDDVHPGLQAQHHRGARVAHHFQAEKFLVEAPRIREVLAHQGTVREQHRIDDRGMALLRSGEDLSHISPKSASGNYSPGAGRFPPGAGL